MISTAPAASPLSQKQARQGAQRRRIRVVHIENASIDRDLARSGASNTSSSSVAQSSRCAQRASSSAACSTRSSSSQRKLVAAIFAAQDGFHRRSGPRRPPDRALQHLLVRGDGLFGAAEFLGEDARQAQLQQASLGPSAPRRPLHRARAATRPLLLFLLFLVGCGTGLRGRDCGGGRRSFPLPSAAARPHRRRSPKCPRRATTPPRDRAQRGCPARARTPCARTARPPCDRSTALPDTSTNLPSSASFSGSASARSQ